MTAWIRQLAPALVAGAAMLVAQMAPAQQAAERVAVQTDWTVFVAAGAGECWGVSAPEKSVNTRSGRVVQVQRGDTMLFVTFRPGGSDTGEIAFTGGYPFAAGSTVQVSVGDDRFDFMTDNEWAWPASTSDDAAVVAALKRGAQAVVVGQSVRGTTTTDTFSLMGFTAAMEEAARRCGR